jgi:hypothetical protein
LWAHRSWSHAPQTSKVQNGRYRGLYTLSPLPISGVLY